MSDSEEGRSSRRLLIGIFVATSAASVMYKVLVDRHLEQTSLLFIGIPTLLAILLALTARPRTLFGVVFEGVTFALLFAGLFLGEGFICLVAAAPLFFLIAGLVAGAILLERRLSR